MNGLLLNLILALVWALLSGDLSFGNLLLGFGIGFLLLVFSQQIVGAPTYARKFIQVLRLLVFFLRELLVANISVALDVLNPRLSIKPGVVGIPLDVRTDAEITLLANLITLTPGTLSLDVSMDRKTLYLHAMNAENPDRLREQIKNGFERRVLEVMR